MSENKQKTITRRQLLTGTGATACALLAAGLFSEIDFDALFYDAKKKHPESDRLVPLFYSKGYNISAFGLERLHPFDGSKYQKIYESIKTSRSRLAEDFIHPESLTRDQLLRFSNVARNEDAISVIDFYDESIYPYPKVSEDWSVAFPSKTDGHTYILKLRETLPQAI